MKIRKLPFFLLLFLVGLLLHFNVFAQKKIETDSPEYNRLKAIKSTENRIQTRKSAAPVIPASSQKIADDAFRACKDLIPIDQSFSIVPFETNGSVVPPFYRNDDRSTLPIAIPFNFCFYGQSYNSLFINNNGSISFDNPHSTFVPDSFPTSFYKMIAPFWADVDTRNLQSGLVYYKITPTYMIVTWDHVGYYDKHADKKNTFQLIITDGLDTILRPGKNVSFRYANMEWTTGDVGGTNGFTDPAATVGANFGDSIKYIQFGRFAAAGNFYDGPFDGYDGISWLNGRLFEFNVCSADNIEPIVNLFNFCDTVYSCIGDSVSLDLSFLSPEVDQITSTVISATNNSGLVITQNNSGKVSDIRGYYLGTPANVGTQKITFTATDNGTPPATLQIELNIKVKPFYDTISVFGADLSICPNATTLLTASSGFENYKWSNNIIAPSINAAPGNYYVIGRKGNCYVSSDTVSVSAIPVIAPVIGGDLTTTICKLDSTLLFVTDSFPKYLWSNGDTSQSAYLNGGLAFVTITDTNGCMVTSNNVMVPHHPVKTIFVSGLQEICPGDSCRLFAEPGFTNYLWSNGIADTSIWAKIGTYSLTALDSNQCLTKSTPYLVNSYAIIPPLIFGDFTYCHGDSATINVHPVYTSVRWNNNDSLNTIHVRQGSYFATLNDQNNCRLQTDTVVVTPFDSIPIPVFGSRSYCPGDSVTLTAGAGFSNYLWSTGSTAMQVNLHAGNYFVEAIDSNACKIRENISVIEHIPIPPTISGNPFVCPGNQALLSCNPSYTQLLWSTGDTLFTILANPGSYSLQALDSNGCAAGSTPIVVANYQVAVPVVTGSLFTCPNDSTLLSAQQNYSHYLWSNGDTNASIQVPVGTYSLFAIDSNSCSAQSNAVTIANHVIVPAQISGNPFCCYNDSSLLSVSNAYSACVWSNGLNGNNVLQAPGQYSVVARDSNGCSSISSTFLVSAFPYQVPSIVGNNLICSGDSALLSCSNNFNTYSWSNGAASSSIHVPNGTYSLTVVDQNNCRLSSANFVLQNFPTQVPDILGKRFCCVGDSVVLSAPQGFHNFLWSNNQNSPQVFASIGNYSLQALDNNNCLSYSAVATIQNSLPQVSIFGDDKLCAGEQGILSLNQNFPTILWNDGSTGTTKNAFSGIHAVQVWDSIGCTAYDSMQVENFAKTQLDFSFNPENPAINEAVLFEPIINLNGNTISAYAWSLNANGIFSFQSHPTYQFADSGLYTVQLLITTNNGCLDSISKTIRAEKKVIIPNVMTPNGDGTNDRFEIINLDVRKSTSLQIADRWGKIIFASNNYQNDWDAEGVANGVYFYTLILEGEKDYHGSFSILH